MPARGRRARLAFTVAFIGLLFLLLGTNCENCEEGLPVECTIPDDCLPACAGFCNPNGVDAAGCSAEGRCECDCSEPGTGGTAGGGGTGGIGGTGGDGGAGGGGGTVDPCGIALPVPEPGSDLFVDVYAVFDTRVGALSFATDGTLFVGNFGRDQADDPSAVFWVTPEADSIDNSSPNLFVDPDALIVDVAGLVGETGNVLIGGINMDGMGQITEMTPTGGDEGTLFVGGCLGNIQSLLFDNANRLLATNFNQANVCAIEDSVVSNLIPDVEGEGPAGATAQDPDTGDLFVTSENVVHRYNSDGTLEQANYVVGTVLAHGPPGSRFDGLVLRNGGMLLLIPDPENPSGQEPLLSGGTGSFVTFDANANLYISNAQDQRVLRVSTEDLDPTGVGCP